MNARKILMVLAVMAVSNWVVAKEPDRVLVFNAEDQNMTCLQLEEDAPISQPAVPPVPPKFWPPRCPGAPVNRNFLSQGERTELRVYNRKFFTDYSITVDAVTTLVGQKIRNLEEAEGLTLGSQSFITPPPAKGGTQGVSALTSGDFLLMMLDETRPGEAVRELQTEEQLIRDRSAQLQAAWSAFQQKYDALSGTGPRVCSNVGGSPDAALLLQCFQDLLNMAHQAPNFAAAPFRNERAFEDLIRRTDDILHAVKTFAQLISASSIVQSEQQLESGIAEYKLWVLNYHSNLVAAAAAANAIEEASKSTKGRPAQQALADELSLQRLRNLLIQSANDPKQIDMTQLNQVLNLYKDLLHSNPVGLHGEVQRVLNAINHSSALANFDGPLAQARLEIGVTLPNNLSSVNAAQSRLLSRINEIYDNSEVREALPKQLDLNGHSGNLIVYFTIRRVEGFKRYEVDQLLTPPTQTPGGNQVVSLPPAAAATPPANQPPAAGGGTAQPASATDSTPGVVVARGQLQVHDFYYANVTAAFAFSKVQDVSILKQPATSTNCTTTNCFTPIEGRRTEQLNLILGVDYYFKPRDTYPGADHHSGWNLLQSFGIMGAISANHANNWFLGPFLEPITGAQLSVGLNFGSEKRLQKPFTLGTPVDMADDFPTDDKRVAKFFFSAGMDLALFRKIFGKITGVGGGAKPAGSQ